MGPLSEDRQILLKTQRHRVTSTLMRNLDSRLYLRCAPCGLKGLPVSVMGFRTILHILI